MRVAGFGFRAAATVKSLQDALESAGGESIAAIATPSDKAGSEAIRSLASALSLPVIEIHKEAMQAVATLTHSEKVHEKRGTGSVAEACALVAAGRNARLCSPRVISKDRLATCAIAEGN